MEIKKRREINTWLVDQEFLENSGFFDLYYFQTLTRSVWNYLINLPIPVLCTWDKVNKRIYFSIGTLKRYFTPDINIAYDDFITLINNWMIDFFPKYEVTYEKEVEYSDEEIIKIIEEENIDLNDAILRRKLVEFTEIGIIEKIFMTEDQFVLNLNGRRQLRLSGTVNNAKPLRVFLKEIRELKDNEVIKKYIDDNSTFIENIEVKNKIIELTYPQKMLFNFVKINCKHMQEFDFIKLKDRTWRWGNYILSIDSDILESDILSYLQEHGFKDKIKI